MHGHSNIKLTKEELLKTNGALRFDKICSFNNLMPKKWEREKERKKGRKEERKNVLFQN